MPLKLTTYHRGNTRCREPIHSILFHYEAHTEERATVSTRHHQAV